MLILALLVACASGDSCRDYITALGDCEAAAGGTTVYDADATCGEWTAEQEDEFGTWYQCKTEYYADADCSDAAQREAATADAETCAP